MLAIDTVFNSLIQNELVNSWSHYITEHFVGDFSIQASTEVTGNENVFRSLL